ncbi:hypothetical protein [Staphylococcus sp. Marseille-Q6910]|uniref:hypothetical protein n=1 Tax=Staphylococcus sp. Marseille-Q6910 TaxID=2937990 RepID=UPI0020423D83|nr:hypothetical protein [Staphylococcus sp. Marseille-Q6910]
MKKLSREMYENIEKAKIQDFLENEDERINSFEQERQRELEIIKDLYPNLSYEDVLDIKLAYDDYEDLMGAIEIISNFEPNNSSIDVYEVFKDDDIEKINLASGELTRIVDELEG